MTLSRFAAVPLAAAVLSFPAYAQLVHVSATSQNLFGELIGYPPAAEPMAGTAKFDLYYDASVTGTNGVFAFNDPAKNFWTLTATINPDGTQPDVPVNVIRSFRFPLEAMTFLPTTVFDPVPGVFALRSPPPDPTVDWWFDVGVVPPSSSTALPAPPFAFGQSWNYFNVSFFEEGWVDDHNIGGGLGNFSAEIISPVPEPSTYGLVGAIGVVLFSVYSHRRRAGATFAAA